MKVEDLRRVIVDACNDVIFRYNGKQSGVTTKVQNYLQSYQAWHGDATKDYINVDALLTDKFFSGKSLSDLAGMVDFEFC